MRSMPILPIASEFGDITLNNGEKLDYDIIVFPPHTILKRKKSLSKEERVKYNHTPFSLKEAQYYIQLLNKQSVTEPKVFLIGTGHYGSLPVPKETITYLEEQGITVLQERTPQAIQKYQELSENGVLVLALFHVTC